MSSSPFLSQLPNWDVKRTLAHVFPGFLLYVGLLMGLDTFVFGQESTLTSLFFRTTAADLDTLLTVIGIGIFLGSILGVMIDGIGHWVFEDKFFEDIVDKRKVSGSLTIKEAEDGLYGYWKKAYHFPPLDFRGFPDFFYPFTYKNDTGEDTVKLKDQLVSDYYSYFEFYLNSAISLSIVSIVLPFYALVILGIIWPLSLLLFGIVFLGAFLLFFASIHTLEDYRKTRFHSLHSFLTKNQNKPTKPTEKKHESQAKQTGNQASKNAEGEILDNEKSKLEDGAFSYDKTNAH